MVLVFTLTSPRATSSTVATTSTRCTKLKPPLKKLKTTGEAPGQSTTEAVHAVTSPKTVNDDGMMEAESKNDETYTSVTPTASEAMTNILEVLEGYEEPTSTYSHFTLVLVIVGAE
ncbi:hypothetical protein PI124_g17005 [Phytophthora idaei]|nr:hypothetical protein PI124_g17005 [Phytophthora idaei]